MEQGKWEISRKIRVERPWPRLPREAVAAPFLAGLKARLDGAGSTLGWEKGSLPMAGGWNQMVCEVPPNPNHSASLQLLRNKDFFSYKFLLIRKVEKSSEQTPREELLKT